MNPECPRIAVCFYGLRFASQILLTVLHITLPKLWLEVRTKLDPVRRIEVDHLHFAAEILSLCEACHYLQRVAENHSIGPFDVMLIELHGAGIFLLRVRKQISLNILTRQ